MASAPWASSFLALALATSSVASAQEASCPSSDVNCRGAKAIMRALNETARRQEVNEFAIAEVCKDEGLKAKARSAYESSIASVVARAQAAVNNDLKDAPAGEVNKVLASTDFAVRAARNAQISGIIAGLESAFSLYPRTRIEYCTRVTAELLK